MTDLNFVVDNAALDTIRSLTISANFDETKAALTEVVRPYKELIVTEEGLIGAKSDRAKIRKVENAIDDYRKNIKKEYLKPFNDFETKCKELITIAAEASANIDTQVKAHEKRKADEKFFSLQEYFVQEQKKSKYPEYVSWELVRNERWKNTTFSMESCKAEIDQTISSSESDIDTIMALHTEYELAVLSKYRETHDLRIALATETALRKEAEEREQRRLAAQEAEQRKEKEAQQQKPGPVEQHQTIEEAVRDAIDADAEAPATLPKNPIREVKLTVWATPENLLALQEFLKAGNYRFRFEIK